MALDSKHIDIHCERVLHSARPSQTSQHHSRLRCFLGVQRTGTTRDARTDPRVTCQVRECRVRCGCALSIACASAECRGQSGPASHRPSAMGVPRPVRGGSASSPRAQATTAEYSNRLAGPMSWKLKRVSVVRIGCAAMVVSGLTSAAPREDGERLSGRPRENEEPLASALSGCPFHPQTFLPWATLATEVFKREPPCRTTVLSIMPQSSYRHSDSRLQSISCVTWSPAIHPAIFE